MEKAGSGGEASKKQTADASDSHAGGATGTGTGAGAGAGTPGEPLSDADPDLIKKLEKERALTHPKKQQNTALLLNAMRTTAAHPFTTFHEREAAAGAGAASDAVTSDGQRSSATPALPLMPSQSTGSQSSYGPSPSQDLAKGATSALKQKKKKRKCLSWTRMPRLLG
jgi:hypothetical protein